MASHISAVVRCLPKREWRSLLLNSIETDILIVGGGPAGMAATARASESATPITIVDDNPRLGGQIWRAELGRTRSAEAAKLLSAVDNGRVKLVNNAQIFGTAGERGLAAETPSGRVELKYKKLILAIGARELFLPFPGWTLPNVFGAGGLQALVKGGLDIRDKRVVVSGTGPLLLAVAEYLLSKGAEVVAIAEQTSSAKLRSFAIRLLRSPQKMLQGANLKRKLLGVPYLTDCWVTRADGDERLQEVTLSRKEKTWMVECDMLACGFHLVPNTELASLLGCRIESGFVAVDAFQKTSCENVYCVGEPTGIGGIEKALIEGEIAGLAAAGNETKARVLFAKRDKARGFSDLLNGTFALRRELRELADAETIVCRCEDVILSRLRAFDSWREAKLQTRCGMGACQGRICSGATEFLFGWQRDSVRPPIFPVRMENL